MIYWVEALTTPRAKIDQGSKLAALIEKCVVIDLIKQSIRKIEEIEIDSLFWLKSQPKAELD